MIIELYGPAGSGKTTLANYLLQHYHWPIVKISTKKELLFLNLIFFVNHPIIFFRRLGYIFSNFVNGRLFYYKLMNFFLQQNAKLIKAQQMNKQAGIVIIDQGMIQSASSVFEKKITSQQLTKYLKNIFYPDILIVFNASEEILKNRTENRGYYIRQFMKPEYIEFFRKISKYNQDILRQLLDNESMNILPINAEKSIEDIATDIMAYIKQNNS